MATESNDLQENALEGLEHDSAIPAELERLRELKRTAGTFLLTNTLIGEAFKYEAEAKRYEQAYPDDPRGKKSTSSEPE